jgi:hypothetical protein
MALPVTEAQAAEMRDVRWFHWQWVARSQSWLTPPVNAGSFHIPGPQSLAHRMLRSFVRERLDCWPGAILPECCIDEGRHAFYHRQTSFCYICLLFRADEISLEDAFVGMRTHGYMGACCGFWRRVKLGIMVQIQVCFDASV